MLLLQEWTWDPAKKAEVQDLFSSTEGQTVRKSHEKKVKNRGVWHDESGTRLWVLSEAKDRNDLAEMDTFWKKSAKLVQTVVVHDQKEYLDQWEKHGKPHGHDPKHNPHPK